eukprot:CAMPEP_0183549210 /NCGR_PEP_ID=MMETSP0371-20130417/63063_1 /TAXON_ID=268820 /ORGANISM="Peridinium aciculiferum, Strain PAER-2" /LENGTH=76 /DNA_ID=CAMNT_0025752883 /DNA_START=20 /DNA_END=246 /DNA_ORIENTATION=+
MGAKATNSSGSLASAACGTKKAPAVASLATSSCASDRATGGCTKEVLGSQRRRPQAQAASSSNGIREARRAAILAT